MVHRLLSAPTELLGKVFGDVEAVRMIARAGFDAYDFSMFDMRSSDNPLYGENYMRHVREVKRAASECGIVCNQSHSPFCSALTDGAAYRNNLEKYHLRAIEITAELGGKIVVIHPNNHLSAEENGEMIYRRLLPFAKSHGVKIAAENMWNWDDVKKCVCRAACSTAADFAAHLNYIDDDYLVACLDIGHVNMAGTGSDTAEMIAALGGKLQALHVHDNDLVHDSHIFPYAGKIDWEKVIACLRQVDYRGDFTFEAHYFTESSPKELMFAAEKFLCEIGRYFLSRLS